MKDTPGALGTPDFPSRRDLEDADFVLSAHTPKKAYRWVCDCGEDYPCPEVRFALLIRGANT